MQIWPYIPVHMSNWAWWFVLILAGAQAFFMVMEICFWPRVATKIGRLEGHVFRDITPNGLGTTLLGDIVTLTRPIGRNMGLYNGFLAAGLAWSLLWPTGLDAQVALFFVLCVLVAGVFGALTVNGLLLGQALLAMFPLVALLRG